MEYTANCTMCDFNEAWTTEEASHCAGIWHLHDMHPDYFAVQSAIQSPIEGVIPRPEEVGRRFEDWERQS